MILVRCFLLRKTLVAVGSMTKACSTAALDWTSRLSRLHHHENWCDCDCSHCEANESFQMWNAGNEGRFWYCLIAVVDGDDAELGPADRDRGLAYALFG